MPFAAIAQPVERILGKDEVASSNLASSSTTRPANRLGVLIFLDVRLATSSSCAERKFKKRSVGFPKSVAFWEAGSQFKSG